MRRGAGRSELGVLQSQCRYIAGAVVLVQAEPDQTSSNGRLHVLSVRARVSATFLYAVINVPSAVLVHEIRRCLCSYDGIDAPFERVCRRVGIPVLFLSRTLCLELDTGIGDVALESAHTIDQCLGKRDRVVQSRSVDPGESSILKTARVHDGLVITGWESCENIPFKCHEIVSVKGGGRVPSVLDPQPRITLT